MKYTELTCDTAGRIWSAFDNHSMYFNKRFDDGITDRDRFVARFFSRFVGEYIAIIDKIMIGIRYDDGDTTKVYYTGYQSVYETSYHKFDIYGNSGRPFYVYYKKFLRIDGFSAVNSLEGGSYIKMNTKSANGDFISYRIDYSFLKSIQFSKISKNVYDSVEGLFADDRDTSEYEAERFLEFGEMVARKLCRKNCAYNKIPSITEKVNAVGRSREEALENMQKKFNNRMIMAVDCELKQ